MITDLVETESENGFVISAWLDDDDDYPSITVQFGNICVTMPEEDFVNFVEALTIASLELRNEEN